jgi:uncharacterized protein YggU (UPF0235/DUF167 family)
MRLTVRVQPGASRPRVAGSRDGHLLVAVRARAVEGQATEAARKAVAAAFGLRPRQVRLVSGATSRTKVFELDGDPAACASRLAELVAG